MRWCVALMLAGCNQLLGLNETSFEMLDAPNIDAPGCAGSTFANPNMLVGQAFSGPENNWDPSTTSDVNELWFTRQQADGSFDLFYATRTGLDQPFDMTTGPLFSTSGYETDAQLTANGLVVVFLSDRLGDVRVFQATRTTPSGTFGDVTLIAPMIPTNEAAHGIDLSLDGLRLYYANIDGELYMVERSDTSQPFGAPSGILATNAHFPSLSPDELELFHMRADPFGGVHAVYRLIRTAPTIAFPTTPAELIDTTFADPEVSMDATVLYFSLSGDLASMSRTCN